MKRIFLYLYILIVPAVILSGCAGTSNETDTIDLGMSKQQIEDTEFDVDIIDGANDVDDGDNVDGESDSDINKYLLSMGMQCIEKMVQELKNIDSGYLQENIQSIENAESVNAVLVPYKAQELIDIMEDYNIEYVNNTLRYLKDYISPSAAMSYLFRASEIILPYEFNQSFAVVLPDYRGQEWILPIFFGDIESPNAGIIVFFQQAGNDIVYIESYDLKKDAAQWLVQNCAEWLDNGIWYTEKELLEVRENFDVEQLDFPESDVKDINRFLVETAVSINNQFYENLISDDFVEYISNNDNVGVEEHKHMSSAVNSFDIGIMVPGLARYWECGAYESVYYRLYWELSDDVFTICSLPENWTEDIAVILGNQDANYYAVIWFKNLNNNALEVEHVLYALPENRKFMGIIDGIKGSLSKVEIESPYGFWTEYEGIQNLDVITADFYDYMLCSGDGYSLVAKQVESVKDVVEYIGVLDEDFNWIVPLSDSTYINPEGYINEHLNSNYYSYKERCKEMSNDIQYAGEGAFVIKNIMMFNVLTSEWLNISGYDTSQPVIFSDGYYVVSSDSRWDEYIIIVSPTTGKRETDIYCESPKYVGRYSEGKFFSYDGFYDIDGNKVIDLSEYAGLIINQPYFLNNECELIAKNSNGTKYKAVIDSDGNFISEFEESW